jgi:hypothetical protein
MLILHQTMLPTNFISFGEALTPFYKVAVDRLSSIESKINNLKPDNH